MGTKEGLEAMVGVRPTSPVENSPLHSEKWVVDCVYEARAYVRRSSCLSFSPHTSVRFKSDSDDREFTRLARSVAFQNTFRSSQSLDTSREPSTVRTPERSGSKNTETYQVMVSHEGESMSSRGRAKRAGGVFSHNPRTPAVRRASVAFTICDLRVLVGV